MHSDSYKTFSEKLNTSAPYLPFGEMRGLVMNHTERRKSAFATFFRYAAGFGLLLLIGGIYFVNNQSGAGGIAHPTNMTIQKMSEMNISNNITKTVTDQKKIVRGNVTRNDLYKNNTAKKENLILDQNKSDNSVTTPQNLAVEKIKEQRNAEVLLTPTTLNAAPTTSSPLIQTSEQNKVSNGNWSAFVSGGPILSNNNFSISSILGAVGLLYRVSGFSSIVVELRHSGFTQNRSSQNGGLRDSLVIVGGQIDKITIGTPSTIATSSTMLVNSLDLGYKYVLNPNDAISPSADILIGASTSGFLSLEAIGIEYRFATSLTLNMSARAKKLFSPSASPLGLLGLEATLGYQW